MLAIMHVLECYLQISYPMFKFKLQFKIRNLLHLFADKFNKNHFFYWDDLLFSGISETYSTIKGK